MNLIKQRRIMSLANNIDPVKVANQVLNYLMQFDIETDPNIVVTKGLSLAEFDQIGTTYYGSKKFWRLLVIDYFIEWIEKVCKEQKVTPKLQFKLKVVESLKDTMAMVQHILYNHSLRTRSPVPDEEVKKVDIIADRILNEVYHMNNA